MFLFYLFLSYVKYICSYTHMHKNLSEIAMKSLFVHMLIQWIKNIQKIHTLLMHIILNFIKLYSLQISKN